MVTIPHKVATVALLDDCSLAVKVSGSCNAVKRRPDGSLYGDMFDGVGFVRAAEIARFIVVNATPLGMEPDDPLPVSVDEITPEMTIGEIVIRLHPAGRCGAREGLPHKPGARDAQGAIAALSPIPGAAARRANRCLTLSAVDRVSGWAPCRQEDLSARRRRLLPLWPEAARRHRPLRPPAGDGQGLRAMKSISTSAWRASPFTPTHVRAGKRSSGK